MAETNLYTIAYEMLSQTNPYKKDVLKISYQNEGKANSLLDMVKQELSSYRSGTRNRSIGNFTIAYNAISRAMVEYLEDFHSSFSFRQKTKIKFCDWLKNIQKNFDLAPMEMPPELEVKSSEMDTGITMLKELHSRSGITKDDLCYKLDIKPRAVQKNLRKLSPNLYEGERENISDEAEYVPFRIGGQPINVDIRVVENTTDRRKYYYTPNTIHPIVMQENLMQVGALLQSLCHSHYYGLQSNIYLQIAIDIWSQLSDYAKEKIRTVYAIRNEDLNEFVEILDDECPDDYVSTYHTEREMAEKEGLSREDKLLFLAKLPERTATITLKKDGSISYIRRANVKNYIGKRVAVTDENGKEYLLEFEQIEDIDLD